MFTGIITDVGEVTAVEPRAQGLARLTIVCGYDPDSIAVGSSIACSGICLTVVAHGRKHDRGWFSVEAAAETLRVTTVGSWRRGTLVNLERALKIGDELGDEIGIASGKVSQLKTVSIRPASLDAPISDDDSTEFGEIVGDEEAQTPFELLRDKKLRNEVGGLLDVLDDREKKIIFQRFGLDGGKPKTLEEVGKKFGVTRERIRQLQNIALSKLRRALSKKERPVDVELPVEA